jgi:hypothetical protein
MNNPPASITKTCNVCEIEKPIEEFLKSMGKCKICYLNHIKEKRLEKHKSSTDIKTCPVCLENKPRNQFEYKKNACIECTKIPKNERRHMKSLQYKAKAKDLRIVCRECNVEKDGTHFEYTCKVCKACDLKKIQAAAKIQKQNTTDFKTCVECQQSYPLSQYRVKANKCYECNKKITYEWRKNNQEEFKKICERYRQNPNYRDLQNTNRKKRYNESLNVRIAKIYRNRIRSCIRACVHKMQINKPETRSVVEFLGCPIDYFLSWLEYNFKDGMTWENQGSYWHIDHITPCASFDFEADIEQVYTCFNWKNHAPLEASENLAKFSKIDTTSINYYQERAKLFEEENPLTPNE